MVKQQSENKMEYRSYGPWNGALWILLWTWSIKIGKML